MSARELDRALTGRALTRSDFRVPRFATADLVGQTVTAVVSHGKHMLTRTDAAITLHTHFEMDGKWRVFRHGVRWNGGPAHQIRVVLANTEYDTVGYRLPVVELLRTRDEQAVVGHLGPDLLGAEWDEAEAVRRLLSQPDREVGPALLDQRNLAGIGNLYKAETLFICGVSPWTHIADVPDLGSVVRTAQQLMAANKERWEQPTTGSSYPSEKHWVFERAGRACLRCGTTIRREMQGDAPYQRITYWCPRCQQ